jgi:uncharacterized protein (TIGR02145 family)
MKRVKENSKVAMLIAMFAITFTSTAFAQEKGTFTDPRDKKKYKTVKIGEQTWMAENLNYLDKADKVSKCYDNKAANCTKYGRLYDWATAMGGADSSSAVPSGVQGICPAGWHIPSKEEWYVLTRFVVKDKMAEISEMAEKEGLRSSDVPSFFLKAKSGWNGNGNGKDSYGFSALPAGRTRFNGSELSFKEVGDSGYWWCSNLYYSAEVRNNTYVLTANGERGKEEKRLIPVRCLQD